MQSVKFAALKCFIHDKRDFSAHVVLRYKLLLHSQSVQLLREGLGIEQCTQCTCVYAELLTESD